MSVPPVLSSGHDFARSQGVGQDHEKLGHVCEKHDLILGHVSEKLPLNLGHDPENRWVMIMKNQPFFWVMIIENHTRHPDGVARY
jgi:hypothetical protein